VKTLIQPTKTEISLLENELIVSKTDLFGQITYVNRSFMRVSDYPEQAVLGKPHNVVRHPDMPRGVYRLMWESLKAEREFFGVIKNMSSKGDFYWVFANVTPDFDPATGKVMGYFSARRVAPVAAVREAADLYGQMLKIEREAGPDRAPEASSSWLKRRLAEQKTSYERFVLALYQQ
jgi:PAS domain S-box-containing protein